MTRFARYLLPVLLLFILMCGACLAESDLKISADNLVGTWKLQGTAQRIDGERNQENQSWEFRSDGTLKSVVQDRRADGAITLTVKYKVDGNKLSVLRAGSNTRWKRFQIIKLEDDELTLKGGIEGYMFFKRVK